MSEIIQSIEECTGVEIEGKYSSQSGYKIVTNEQEITLLIDDRQCCCESWGYFISEDNPQDYIGAELINITLTDTASKTYDLPEYGLEDGGVMFVNLETSKGTLQFVAYNAHNGYYGHTANIKSKQLEHEVRL